MTPTLDTQGHPPLGYELRERDGIRYLVPSIYGPFRHPDPDEWHYATPADAVLAVQKYGPTPRVSTVDPALRGLMAVDAIIRRG